MSRPGPVSAHRAGAGLAAVGLFALACSGGSGPPAPTGPRRLLEGPSVAADAVPITAGPVAVGREVRLALLQTPTRDAPTRSRRFDVRVAAGDRLDVGYGVPNVSLAAQAAPVSFRLAALPGDGSLEVLFERTLDPARVRARRWFDLRVDLDRFADREIELELSVTSEAGARGPGSGAWSDPVVYAPGAHDPRPSFLVVSIDTLRARDVGAYGYPRDTTPFLDATARRGALFEQALTAAVTTGPSHMSLFTGLYPVNHGLRTGLDRKAPGVATAAQLLRAAGYQTAAFTEDGYVIRERGFGEGFSSYTENHGKDPQRVTGEVRLTFGQARRWLEQRARTPFFLFVHTYQVHHPYRPPPAYRALFEDDGVPGPDDPALRRMRDDYDREIRFVDDELKRLVAAVGSTGHAGHTVLVVLSDHGEEFGEHGGLQHGHALFEESLRVPLVFVGPGIAPARHAEPVSLIDVLPTLLELAGVPAPPALDGRSLVPALRGGGLPPERTLFAEARARLRWVPPAPGRSEHWNPPLVAVRSPHTKFVVHRPETGEARPPVRYDLDDDALEEHPRPLDPEELRTTLKRVDDYLAGSPRAAERRPPDDPSSLDPDLRERLRALGYLD